MKSYSNELPNVDREIFDRTLSESTFTRELTEQITLDISSVQKTVFFVIVLLILNLAIGVANLIY